MTIFQILFVFTLSLGAHAAISISDLHGELKQTHTNPLEYKVSKVYIFNNVDNRDGRVCSAYTPSECKSYSQSSSANKNSNKHFKLNTEHTWPQSKGAKHFPAKGDLHHLYAASKESNSRRANFPFCYVYETYWEKQGSKQGFNTDLQDCFEPLDSHKGNVARAMFYFSVRYNKPLSVSQEKLFRSWNKLDPVDENEMIRNERIERIQGNINPFIKSEVLIDNIESFQFDRY